MKRGDMRAFPGRAWDEDGTEWIHPGLTIREYFAAAALQGFLSNPKFYERVRRRADDLGVTTSEFVAQSCLGLADQMLSDLKEFE